jgi:hypothetical protein
MKFHKNLMSGIIIMALQPFVGPWPFFPFFDPIQNSANTD